MNVSQNVSQQAAPQQQGNGTGMMGQGTTVTHHHYHLLNHAGGPEVLAAMGVAGADQASDMSVRTRSVMAVRCHEMPLALRPRSVC